MVDLSEKETREKVIDPILEMVGWRKEYVKEEVNPVKSNFKTKEFSFDKDNIERGVEKKVVASKLSRAEFANFINICDREKKNVNQKIRELVNREISRNFASPKLKNFNEYTLREYNDSLVVEDIATLKTVEKTDGTFTQIGFRPLIEDDFLTQENFAPHLPGAGRDVAIGERDFLIKNILENKDIAKIKFKEDTKEFPKHAFEFNKANILISLDFFVELSQKLMGRIEYKDHQTILDSRYKLIFVPDKVMGKKIIIVDENAILWEKQKFHNEFTDKDETLDIQIKRASEGKADITIKSVNKIKYLDTELIKILEVGG